MLPTSMGHGDDARWFTCQGVSYHVLLRGQGPGVLLLHGGGNQSAQWRGQVSALSPRYQVIAPDLLVGSGHSMAPTPEWPFTLADEAACLAALLIDVGCTKAHVIGHSYGGTLGLALALGRPDQVASLALIEPNPSGLMRSGGPRAQAVLSASAEWRTRLRGGTDIDSEAVMAAFVDSRRGPGTWAGLSPHARQTALGSRSALVRGFDALLAFAPAPESVAALHMPVLLIQTELSPPDFRVPLDFLGELLPSAERLSIQGVGHFGPIERPELFNAPLQDWLARVSK